jgi:hypothetical protein
VTTAFGETTAAAQPSVDRPVGTPPGSSAATKGAASAETTAPAPPVAIQPDRPAEPAASARSPTSQASKAPDQQKAPEGARSSVPRGGETNTFAEINKVVRAHLGSIKKQCWEPAFAARGPDAPSNSKVIVSLNISPDGKVQSAEASGGDGFPGLASCVQTQAANLRFPASTEATVVSVPFVFAAQ